MSVKGFLYHVDINEQTLPMGDVSGTCKWHQYPLLLFLHAVEHCIVRLTSDSVVYVMLLSVKWVQVKLALLQ